MVGYQIRITKALIRSIIENDTYKLTMAAGFFVNPELANVDGEYELTIRCGTKMPYGMMQELRHQLELMCLLQLKPDELTWMNKALPFLPRQFVDYFRFFRFDHHQVTITQKGGDLKVKIRGPLYQATLWEVPILAIISESYYILTGQKPDMEIFWTNLKAKQEKLVTGGCNFVDFGMRRRASGELQELVVKDMTENCPDNFMGTSNMYLAMKYNCRPIGTHAHEWFMAMQGIFGTRTANRRGLEFWSKTYKGDLGTALTDTFTTESFLNDFTLEYALQFKGVRQDSGDPFEIGHMYVNHWNMLKMNPLEELIIFSDGLETDKAVALQAEFGDLTQVAFGIGTFFSNDCGLIPLKIVIKLTMIRDLNVIKPRWVCVVKISDSPGKHHGPLIAINATQHALGLELTAT